MSSSATVSVSFVPSSLKNGLAFVKNPGEKRF
jgi:hypothetical protein